jgi:NhaP-type Na+/H+ or K+/H+ antiporter
VLIDLWFTVIGLLLLAVALAGSYVKRLPLSTSMVYLGAGIALGPGGVGMLRIDALKDARLLERLSEIAVIVSLFTAGLKLRLPLRDPRWRPAFRLASLSMVVTVGLIALAGRYLLDLPWGAGVLLGAVLAPTDPVLASDVQVEHPHDRDELRFGLTAEAGLNDGTAFPFVMLGLGLLGAHELGPGGGRWLAIDLIWAVFGGLLIGAALGAGVARLVLYLRRKHKEAVGLDDFLAVGLIALSYGLALLAHSYGFLAVFAAGLAMRTVERKQSGDQAPKLNSGGPAEESKHELATHPEKAPAYMAHALLEFNEQLERAGEIAVVVLIGALLRLDVILAQPWWFVPLLFLAIRPAAVYLGMAGSRVRHSERSLMGWFGIRGIGSLYYLTYAITHGLPAELAERLAGLTLLVIAASVLIHGISVTPLMNRYRAREG